ncbi:MAG: hypothetical protein M3458_04770 [Acidobacteriota bacterium]|nr:hypothetical protein [Acidobacteriota bacterium]
MNWQSDIKNRYATKGWEAFRAAEEAFRQHLERFCAERSISIIDDNPEGQDWMVLLKDGTELYVDRRSYDTEGAQAGFWIEYSPEHGGIIAEFSAERGRPHKHEVIIPNADISAVCDKW